MIHKNKKNNNNKQGVFLELLKKQLTSQNWSTIEVNATPF